MRHSPRSRTQNLLKGFLPFVLVAAVAFCATACESERQPAQTESSKPPIPKPAIAPGTVELSAEIEECSDQSHGTDCTLRVIAIHEYGAATPQLPVETRIRVSFRDSLLILGGETESSRLLVGEELSLTISAAVPRDSTGILPPWRAVRISE